VKGCVFAPPTAGAPAPRAAGGSLRAGSCGLRLGEQERPTDGARRGGEGQAATGGSLQL